MDQQQLNVIIRDLFESGDSDPYDVAERVMLKLDPADHESVLRIVLPSYTRVMAGRQRKRLDGMAKPVFVPSSGWKDMSQLTASECREIAAEYRKRAEQNASLADEFENWATALDRDGVAVLGDLAEFRRYMSVRTKEGMAKAKANGRNIGRPVTAEQATLHARIRELRSSMTLQKVADTLNAEGLTTSQGNPWTAPAIHKITKKELVEA
ncbi:hypothetical protein SEA_ZEPP_59 [Microbacterium phage Zepp]|nr:hypothetical protein SEA_ZEPP_59 [Microbacterium phage Zepp]